MIVSMNEDNMNKDVAAQQLKMLQHFQRVNEGTQLYLNSVQLSREQIRLCNQAMWPTNDMQRLKALCRLNEMTDSNILDDKTLYQLNEKLRLVMPKSDEQHPENSLLDGNLLTIVLLRLLIRICEIIFNDCQYSLVHQNLQKAVLSCINNQFVKKYADALWTYAKQEF